MPALTAESRITAFAAVVVLQLASGDAVRNLIGWTGWGISIALCLVWAIAEFVLRCRELGWRRVAVPGTAPAMFVTLAYLSAIWAASWWSTLLGATMTLGILLAALVIRTLPTTRILAVLHWTLQGLLIASIAIELIASVTGPIRPVWSETVPGGQRYVWAPGALFREGRMHGVTGNPNLTGMLALLALIIAVGRAVAGQDRRGRWAWILLPVACIVLTRSATVALCTLVVVGCAVLIWVRFRVSREAFYRLFWASVSAAGIAVIVGAVAWPWIAELLNRSPDLTGRLDFWRIVLVRWLHSPIIGDGWMGYWMPWVEPYGQLLVQRGLVYLQAHNAWLDVMLQLGIVGLLLFIGIQAAALQHSVAIVRHGGEHPALRAIPLLIMAALIVQCVTESRPITEIGALLLFLTAAGEPRKPTSTLGRNE